MASQGTYQVRALERALEILALFSLNSPELSLAEIATQTNVAKSTTLRLVSVLTDYGFLERLPDTERYRIGIRAFEVGSVYIQSTSIESEARPFLEKLAIDCHQTANLGVLNRNEVVHLAVVPPDRAIRFYASVGDREAAYCSGLGKALISEFSDEALDELIEQHPLEMKTRRTIVSADILRSHLEGVRAQGYAIDDEESIVGLRCVAVPVRNDKGEIVAAISVSGPSIEFDERDLARYVDLVKDAAHSISTRLGYGAHLEAAESAALVQSSPR